MYSRASHTELLPIQNYYRCECFLLTPLRLVSDCCAVVKVRNVLAQSTETVKKKMFVLRLVGCSSFRFNRKKRLYLISKWCANGGAVSSDRSTPDSTVGCAERELRRKKNDDDKEVAKKMTKPDAPHCNCILCGPR